MIDEKKLLEDLMQCKELGRKSFEAVVNTINGQPKVCEWIPCSERLPEESLNSVIGWDAYRKRCCFVQYYNGRWILGNDIDSVKIIAWMPVPEPYKGESE